MTIRMRQVIRSRRKFGFSRSAIAKEFGLSLSQVDYALRSIAQLREWDRRSKAKTARLKRERMERKGIWEGQP